MPTGEKNSVSLRLTSPPHRVTSLPHPFSSRWFIPTTGVISITLSLFLYLSHFEDFFITDDFGLIYYSKSFGPSMLLTLAHNLVDKTALFFAVETLIRPIISLSTSLEYSLWNLNPLGYHLTSFVANSFCILLVIILTWLVSGNRAAAALSGLFFAASPLHLEAVIWFAGESHIIATLFITLSLICFITYRRTLKRLYLFAAIFGFCLALLSNESALVLPLFMAAYEIIMGKDFKWKVDRRSAAYLPFLGLGFIYSIAHLLIGVGGEASVSEIWSLPSLSSHFEGLLRAVALPVNLNFFSGRLALGYTILLAIALVVNIRILKNRVFLFGLSILLISMIPYLVTRSMTEDLICSRFFYLGSVGISLGLGVLLGENILRRANWIIAVGMLLMLIVFSVNSGRLYSTQANESSAFCNQLSQLYSVFPRDAQIYLFDYPKSLNSPTWPFMLIYNTQNIEGFRDVVEDDNFSRLSEDLGRSKFALFWNSDQNRLEDLTQLLSQKKTLANWDTAEISSLWNINNLSVQNGALTTKGGDPYLISPSLTSPDQLVMVEIKMKVSSPNTGYGQIYFSTAQSSFNEDETSRFEVHTDGEWHTYQVWVINRGTWQQKVQKIRLDPTSFPADLSVEYIKVWYADSEAMKLVRSGA